MSARLLTDDLWNEIHSFFPVYRPAPQGGRPPIANRMVLTAILFVLKSGIAWEDLPLEIGCSYKSCQRRLQQWTRLGIWPRSVTADKGCDCQASRDLLAACGIATHIPRRGEDAGPPLGRLRWPIERTLSWLKQFRRLRIRWERLAHLYEAFLHLGGCLIAWRHLSST